MLQKNDIVILFGGRRSWVYQIKPWLAPLPSLYDWLESRFQRFFQFSWLQVFTIFQLLVYIFDVKAPAVYRPFVCLASVNHQLGNRISVLC